MINESNIQRIIQANVDAGKHQGTWRLKNGIGPKKDFNRGLAVGGFHSAPKSKFKLKVPIRTLLSTAPANQRIDGWSGYFSPLRSVLFFVRSTQPSSCRV